MEGALTTAWNGTKADISARERVWKCRLIHDCEWFSYRDRGVSISLSGCHLILSHFEPHVGLHNRWTNEFIECRTCFGYTTVLLNAFVDSIICPIQCTPLIAPEAVYQTHIEIFTLNNIWLKNVHKQSQYLDIYGTKNQKGPFLDDANFGRFLLTPVILPKRKSLFNS